MEDLFSAGNAKYEVVREGFANLLLVEKECDQFTVPAGVISPNGSKFVIIGFGVKRVKSQINKHVQSISFNEPSMIQEVPTSFIFCCLSIIKLPPSVKRIRGDSGSYSKGLKICIDKSNKFVSIAGRRSIINHYPFEILCQSSRKFNLHIRETVRIIGFASFLKNMSITSVFIPSSVEIIDDHAFDRCPNIQKIIFKGKSQLKRIGSHAFHYTSVSHLSFPSTLEEIRDCAFVSSNRLTSIEFGPNSKLKRIGSYAFGFTIVKFVEFPASVEEIGDHAFRNCDCLSSIKFPKDSKLLLIGENAFRLTIIEAIDFPASVEVIKQFAFSGTNLTRISLPVGSNLKKIGDQAFRCTKIKSVVLPRAVELQGSVFMGNNPPTEISYQ